MLYLPEAEQVKLIALSHFPDAIIEARLWDSTRVDILTKEYAIEVDWADKWAEGLGQSLYYSITTNKKPGLVLLIKDIKKESQFVYRAQIVAAKHDIKVWVINASE